MLAENKGEPLNLFKNPGAKRSEVLLDVQVNKRVVFDPERVMMFMEFRAAERREEDKPGGC